MPLLCHSLAVQPWASCSTSLGLSSPVNPAPDPWKAPAPCGAPVASMVLGAAWTRYPWDGLSGFCPRGP